MEKAREATDMANIRAAYAEASADLITNETPTYSNEITAQQKKAKWQSFSDDDTTKIGNIDVTASTNGWTVAVDVANNTVTITAKP